MSENKLFKVELTKDTMYGPSRRFAHGFSITDFRGAPLLTLHFATEEEAKEAETQVREIVGKTVHIDARP